MSDDKDIAAGILMRERQGTLSSLLASLEGSLFHRGWVDAEAEVLECTAPGSQRYIPYLVTFAYVVEGKSYECVLGSPDEVEKGDKFAIRYDPRHPEKNNTFDSETNWATTYTTILGLLIFLTLLFGFIWSHFFRT